MNTKHLLAAAARCVSAFVLGGLLVVGEAQATNIWTSNASADWKTAANWNPANVPDGAGEIAVFNGSGTQNNVTFSSTFGGNGFGGVHVTSGQTAPLSITNTGGANIVFRLLGNAGVQIDAGAGAVSFGGSGNAFYLNLGTGTSNFVNNSSHLASFGSNVTLNASGGTSPSVAFSGSGDWQHNGAFSNTIVAVSKSGAGTLTLNGASGAFTGGTTVNGGTLRLEHTAAAGTGLVQIGDGTLSLFRSAATTTYGFSGITSLAGTNGTLTVDGVGADQGNNANAIYATGPITVNGTLTIARPTGGSGTTQFNDVLAGSGTLIIGDTNGGVALSGASRGRLLFNNSSNTFNGAVQILSGGNFLNNKLNPTYASLDIATDGYFTLIADPSMRTTTVGALNGAGNIIRNTQSGVARLAFGDGDASGNFSGAIDQTAFGGGAGAIALMKLGGGTQVFSGTSNHTGATTISGGTLEVRGAGRIQNTSGISVAENATFRYAPNAAHTFDRTVTGDGTLRLQYSGPGDYYVNSNLAGFNGQVIFESGSSFIRPNGNFSSQTAKFHLDSGARVNLSGNVVWGEFSGDATALLGSTAALARTVTFGHLNTDATYAGATNGVVLHFIKEGTGTQTFTNTLNRSNATTTINAGTLELAAAGAINSPGGITLNGPTARFLANSSIAVTAPITLTQGTVGGTGTISSPLTIGTGGVIAPGNSAGTLTTGDQTWAAGGTYLWEIDSVLGTQGGNSGWDWIDGGASSLTLSATQPAPFTIDIRGLGSITGWNPDEDNAWVIASFGSINGFDPAAFLLDTNNFGNPLAGVYGTGAFSISQIGNDVVLSYSAAVPEPSTLALAGLGIALAAAALRKRNRKPRVSGSIA